MKHMMFAGDFNITVLNYEYNRKVKRFFYLMYQRNLIPPINKGVGKNSVTANDQIITDYVLTCDFKTTILKTDLTNHFPVVIALKNDGRSQQRSKTKYLYKRNYNEENIKAFNHRLLTINWDEIKKYNDPSEACKQLQRSFSEIKNKEYSFRVPG